jgi:hypothetical protein
MMASPCRLTLQEREVRLDPVDEHTGADSSERVHHPSGRKRIDGQASADRNDEEHGLQAVPLICRRTAPL